MIQGGEKNNLCVCAIRSGPEGKSGTKKSGCVVVLPSGEPHADACVQPASSLSPKENNRTTISIATYI